MAIGVHLAAVMFPISRDPPEGGTLAKLHTQGQVFHMFPISRDPPEGGTVHVSLQ